MEDLTRLPGDASVVTKSGSDWERLAPGTLFAGRSRVVAPLGRGGMGEVYRAEDLKLDQTVALEFLPDHVARDPARLAQFHTEVRIARTISHRNVCRTYDIADADGPPRRSSVSDHGVRGRRRSRSLLRRIGRFPQDKAIELAIFLAGVVLVIGVLLRFGLLAVTATFYTFLTMQMFPLTTDLSRPYAGTSAVVLIAIAALAAYGFYASRGDEPLFGRALLD